MKAIAQYNEIMSSICRAYNTINTSFSDGTKNWNLRDMVSEMQYTLDIYDDESCIYWEEAHDDSQPAHKPWLKEWINNKARMKRFIKKYKDEALKMECVQHHSSCFD